MRTPVTVRKTKAANAIKSTRKLADARFMKGRTPQAVLTSASPAGRPGAGLAKDKRQLPVAPLPARPVAGLVLSGSCSC